MCTWAADTSGHCCCAVHRAETDRPALRKAEATLAQQGQLKSSLALTLGQVRVSGAGSSHRLMFAGLGGSSATAASVSRVMMATQSTTARDPLLARLAPPGKSSIGSLNLLSQSWPAH